MTWCVTERVNNQSHSFANDTAACREWEAGHNHLPSGNAGILLGLLRHTLRNFQEQLFDVHCGLGRRLHVNDSIFAGILLAFFNGNLALVLFVGLL